MGSASLLMFGQVWRAAADLVPAQHGSIGVLQWADRALAQLLHFKIQMREDAMPFARENAYVGVELSQFCTDY
jgi:hypothetical protein